MCSLISKNNKSFLIYKIAKTPIQGLFDKRVVFPNERAKTRYNRVKRGD